jgi:triacylglycerol lipase
MASTTFDPTLATAMAVFCELTYAQYQAGLTDPGYDGSVAGLTPPPPTGFVQTASFKAPEINIGHNSSLMKAAQAPGFDLTSPAQLQSLAASIQDVYFGFAGTWNGTNIVALRGTQSPEEWLADLTVAQIDVPLVWFDDGKFQIAKAHLGFVVLFAFLYQQVLSALRGFSISQPVYATGHSLGHPLAVFSALLAKLQVYGAISAPESVQLYSFAGPRVGDPAFASAYNFFIPASFRVVNLSDVVPVVPPTSVFGYQYQHVGQEWSYLFQAGNITSNHSLTDNYVPAVTPPAGPVETDAPRTFPASGL